MEPKVSVLIPTYGGDKTAVYAIQSVLDQDYENFEVIVVDDNNPETEARKKTESYMTEFADDDRVKYIRHKKNKNGSAARNTGFKNSSGSYICLLDDDDIFLPGKIKKQVNYLECHHEFGACYCWRKESGKDICGELEGDLSEHLLDLSFTPQTSTIMLRRDCYQTLNGFDESYRRHQDFEFLLRFFKVYKMGVVKEVLVSRHGNNINNQPHGKKLYELKKQFFSQFNSDIEQIDKKRPGFKKKVYAEHFARAFKDELRYGNFGYAFKMYFNYGYKGGMDFWKVFNKCCLDGMKERLSMIKHK